MKKLSLISIVILIMLSACQESAKVVPDNTPPQVKKQIEAQKPQGEEVNNTALSYQNKEKEAAANIDWLSFDDIVSNPLNDNKKYLVDVYTDWCGWCKVMDRKTFTDPTLQAYLDDNFHMIKFNAEQTESVKFRNKDYDWVAGGRKGINELAKELLDGRLSYPSLVYLDKNLDKIAVSPGYKNAEQLLSELKSLEN